MDEQRSTVRYKGNDYIVVWDKDKYAWWINPKTGKILSKDHHILGKAKSMNEAKEMVLNMLETSDQ